MELLSGVPYCELRVHGVSGTPPADMLGMRPRLVPPEANMLEQPPTEADEADADVTVWRSCHAEPDLRAFSWGSLTSGRPGTAFYVLLLPYMLANFAGWMMLPLQKDPLTLAEARADPNVGRSWPLRAVTLLVRLAGLLVTVIFALSTYLIVTDLGAYQWVVRGHDRPAWLVGVGVLLTGGAIWLLFYFTRVRLRSRARYKDPWADEADPVGYAWIHRGQAELWNHPGIIVRLRRLHVTGAWASVALVAGYARPWMPGGEWQAWDRAAVGLAITALTLAVVLLGAVTLGRGVRIPQWVSRAIRSVSWLTAVALLVSAVRIAGIGAPGEWPPSLPAIRGTAYWVALTYLVLVISAGLVGWFRRSQRDVPARARWNLPGMLMLAAATGSGLGAGFALQARRLLGGCGRLEASNRGGCDIDIVVGPYGDWLAIALTIGLVLFGSLVLFRVLRAYRRTHRSTSQRVMVAVHKALEQASWLLFLMALGGLGILTGMAVAAARGGLPDATSLPRWIVLGVTVPLLASIAGAAIWLIGRVATLALRVVAVVALIVLTVVAIRNGWQYAILGLPVPPTTFLELAQLVGLLPLVLLVTRSIYAGLQDRSVRRGVGILWDVGTFWPRWFHPFAPPTYSDRAVTHLTAELELRLMDPDHRVLLAPHSQGAIIGTAAILGMTEAAEWRRVALLTYGSPWSRFYAELCPAMFSSACLESLCDRLEDGDAIRWRNLYRTSDPIGGPIGGPNPIPDIDVELPDDKHGRVHSSYDLEVEYQNAVHKLRHLLYEEQAPSEQHGEDQHKAGGAGEGGQERGTLDGAGQQAGRRDGERDGTQRPERVG